ncbi:response regulator [Endobacterium cereale]|uniref:response regulator n=1 Tax=Endobacterium cereale TaxID=2663029 RepID=UPI002B46C524|nr:response regulator [Endobacterium cereale]MEB2848076.1 response regulator [Endobacterium cereale]
MDLRGHISFDQRSLVTTVVIADPFFEKTSSLGTRLAGRNCQVIACPTIGDAMTACLKETPAFILTELRFPDGAGLDLVRWVSAQIPEARTIVHTWFADIPTAVAAATAGAADLVPKPTDEEFLVNILLHGSLKIPLECKIESPERLRREHIEHVVKANRSNVSLAARQLQLDRRSLQRLLKRYESKPSLS